MQKPWMCRRPMKPRRKTVRLNVALTFMSALCTRATTAAPASSIAPDHSSPQVPCFPRNCRPSICRRPMKPRRKTFRLNVALTFMSASVRALPRRRYDAKSFADLSGILWNRKTGERARASLGRVLPLVAAAREQRNQNHQVRQREQPLIRRHSCRFRRTRDHPKMPAAREIMQVIHADAGQAGHFRVGENLLARFNSNQGLPHVHPPLLCHHRSCDAPRRLEDANYKSNSRSV
jgi:hypothetical protein